VKITGAGAEAARGRGVGSMLSVCAGAGPIIPAAGTKAAGGQVTCSTCACGVGCSGAATTCVVGRGACSIGCTILATTCR